MNFNSNIINHQCTWIIPNDYATKNFTDRKKLNYYKLFAKIYGYPEYTHFLKLDREFHSQCMH